MTTITLTDDAIGSYSSDGIGGSTTAVGLFAVGTSWNSVFPKIDQNGFIAFDLSSVHGTITSLELQCSIWGFFSQDSLETIVFYGVATPTSILETSHTAGSVEGLAIYNDLQDGTSYGTAILAPTDYSFSTFLAPDAVSIANFTKANGTDFSIGIDLSSIDHAQEVPPLLETGLDEGMLLYLPHLVVTSLNSVPQSADDNRETTEDTPLIFDPRTNDTDADGDGLSIVQVSQGLHGTVIFTSGELTYIPFANYFGTDTFTYTASDGWGGFSTATVNVTVTAVNDAPVAGDLFVFLQEDTSIGYLNQLTVLSSDPDGDDLTPVLVSGPAYGSLIFDGSIDRFEYTPDANYFGSDSFTYKMNDGSLDSNVATVFITVDAVNDAPVATEDSYTTDEDVALTVAAAGLLANDSDIEGDALNAVLVAGPAHGTLALNADGSFTYTPVANYNGSDSFSYQANDGSLSSDPVPVQIAINAVNDPPVANADSDSVGENETKSFAVLSNDTDADGDPLTLTSIGAVTVTSSNSAVDGISADDAFTIEGDQIEFSPGSLFDALAAGETATVVVNYTIEDPSGASATSALEVTVSGENDAAVIVSGGGGDEATYFVRVNNKAITTIAAEDPDSGAEITYSIVGGANAELFTIDDETGELSFKSLPVIPHKTYEVEVQADDGAGGTDSQTIVVNVSANQMNATADPDNVDTFVFHEGFGSNSVRNFDATTDILQFDSGMFADDTADAVLAAAHETKQGDVVIETHAGRIELIGVSLDQLGSGDGFLFV